MGGVYIGGGIGPVTNDPNRFSCLLCGGTYKIQKMGHSAVTQHIGQANHRIKKDRTIAHLKEKILLILEENEMA